jgi:hypothetical protein
MVGHGFIRSERYTRRQDNMLKRSVSEAAFLIVVDSPMLAN